MTDRKPADLRPAATVVIARGSESGVPEILFLLRPESMRFLPGFHTFPGGAVHSEDASAEARSLSTLSDAEADSAVGEPHSLPFYLAALRELFEECGLLYASTKGSREVIATGVAKEVSGQVASGVDFYRALADKDLQLCTHLLRFQDRWIAPESLPIRFDSRVFVAPLLGEPVAHADEVAAIDWMSAAQVLAKAEAGLVQLAPPTAATIASIARFDDLRSLLAGEHSGTRDQRIERHSRVIRRLVAPNPSLMTGPGTNTYLVGEDELLVIDPGSMEQSHLDAIASAGTVRQILLTHGHSDHFSGALDLAQMTGATIAASPLFWNRSALASQGTRLDEGDAVSAGGVSLQVLDTPGHASDHISFWLESEQALFCGDLILGEGTTVIAHPDGNLTDYLTSLDKAAVLNPRRLYPGHFSPRDDAVELISWYRTHRLERESQVIEAMVGGARTPSEIARSVYEGYDPGVLPIAERSVRAHLQKLLMEGRVSSEGETFSVIE